MHFELSKQKKYTSILIATMGMALSSAFAQSYPAPDVAGPSTAYTFPAGFSQFAPPVNSDAPAAGAPSIAEWTRINDPGDTMVLTGESLSKYTGTFEGRDSRFIFFGQFGAVQTLADGMIQRLDDREVAVTLPSSLPTDEMYLVWAKNDNGIGIPAAINQTEGWWVGSSKPAAGERFSVYGRNLSLGQGKSYLYIEELGRWLTSVAQNPYKADFILPNDIANGTYTIWAHNGHGQQYGWSLSMNLEVVDGFDWNGATINVKNSPYNAKGDGSSDDRNAIQSAINDANSGDTVYLPAGTYLIGNQLSNLGGVRIMGAGMNQTTIRTHPNMGARNGTSMIHGEHGGGFEVKNLTVHSGNYLSGNTFRARSASNIRLENVRLSEANSTVRTDLVDISGAKYVKFVGCEFFPARNVFVGRTKQISFENCDWYGVYDCNVLLSTWGADELSVSGCTAQNYDDSSQTDGSGWCKGRFTWGSGHGGVHRNLYFGDLRITDMHPRYDPRFSKYEQPVDQNSGENIMFELTATHYEGRPAEVSGNNIRLSGSSSSISGGIVVVIDGKGVGQSRMVTSHNTSTGWITVDEPWRVVPDTGSTLAIGNYVNRMVVYGSYFDGHERLMDPLFEGPAAKNNTATTAVSVYGGFQDLVVADNEIQQARQGIISWGFGYDAISPDSINNLQPNYFNIFSGNSIDSCYDGIVNVVATFNSHARSPGTIIAYNTWRKNQLSNITGTAVVYHAPFAELPIGMCVYENNVANTFSKCIRNADNLKNQIWINNSFDGGGSGTAISFSNGHVPVLRDNTWTDFATVYGSAEPGSVLELPVRSVVVGEDTVNVSAPIFNSGTDSMSWSASSSESWLQVATSSGSVTDEGDSDTLALIIDTAAVTSGNVNPAIVTVSAGSQMKQLSVIYDENAALPPPPDPPPAPVLTGIAISGPASVSEESSAQFTCTASYSDGTAAQVDASWSENSPYAVIDGFGLFSAGDVLADQSVTVTASYDGLSDSFDLTINFVPPTLDRIEIAGPASLDEGTDAQYSCTAYYSDGASTSVTPTWSENGTSTTIDSSGLLTAGDVTADQSVTVSASFGGQTDTHAVTVNYIPPTLTGLVILGGASIDEQASAQYTCIGSFSDGTTAPVIPAWSENSAVATISSSGLLSVGNVDADQTLSITASLSGINVTRTITINFVPPFVTAIEISGATALNEETTSQYTCEAIYSDGSRASVAPQWSVSSGPASIDAAGLLTAGNVTSDQTATITASLDGKSDSFSVAISYVAPSVTGITIFGPLFVDEGNSASYTCIASYSDGTTGNVTPAWSDNSPYVSINTSGVMTTGDVATDETITLSASFDGFADTHDVLISYVEPPVVLIGISISAPAVMDENSAVDLTCTATYSDGSTAVVEPLWSVAEGGAASVDSLGQLSVGNIDENTAVTVTASFSGQNDTSTINVWAVGTQIFYPLYDFTGKTVKARLWDDTAQEWHDLGEMDSPEQLVVENVATGRWYWVSIEEFDQNLGTWAEVHANWISM